MEEYVIVTPMFSVKYETKSVVLAIQQFCLDADIPVGTEILGVYKKGSLKTILATKFKEDE